MTETREPLVLLINLDRSKDRLSEVSKHLAERGVTFERLSAVEGRDIPLPAPGIAPDDYKRNHGRTLRPGEIGCYLSHLKAMKRFLASSHDYCVVLEDDVLVSSDFNDVITDLIANDLYGYGILRLQGRRYGLGISTQRLAGQRKLKAMLTRVTGSTAYILTRRAAERCVARLLPMQAPYDHAYDRPLHLGVRIAHVVPYPASEMKAIGSTIELPKAERRARARLEKVGPIAKLSVLRWRAVTEVSRTIAACIEGFRRLRSQPVRRIDQLLAHAPSAVPSRTPGEPTSP